MIVSFISLVVMVVMFSYADSYINNCWAMELLDCVFRKTEMGFYEYSALNTRNAYWYATYMSCDKTILVMIPLAIWCIPEWIAHEITGEVLAVGFWDIMWLKLGLMLCVSITSVECAKIVRLIRPEADSLLVYPLIFGSFEVLFSIGYFGQDEIVYLMFLVLAFRYIISGKIRRFLLFATMSVSLNIMMIVPILLMILFYEKRPVIIVLYSALTIVPTGIFNFLYRSDAVYHQNNWMDMAGDAMGDLFKDDISLSRGEGTVSLFLLVICILAVYSFLKKKESSSTFDVAWVVSICMTSMTLLANGSFLSFSYRRMIYIPFLIIVVLAAKSHTKMNILFYGFYTAFSGWLCTIAYHENMRSCYLSFHNPWELRIAEYYGDITMRDYYGTRIPILSLDVVFVVVCLTMAITLYYINYKLKDRELETINIKEDLLVLLISFITPAMLIGYVYMLWDYSECHRVMRFGSSYVEQAELEGDYRFRWEGMVDELRSGLIVFEDGVCVNNGEDKNGRRYLHEGGVSFGPYTILYPGTYVITINGENLDEAGFDCVYSQDYAPYPIEMTNVNVTEHTITYQITIDENRCIETTIMNYSSEDVILDQIDIQEIR